MEGKIPIVERYQQLPHEQGDRMRYAEELVEDPRPLATDFAVSVERLERSYRNMEPFYPKPRPEHEYNPERIGDTKDLAFRLKGLDWEVADGEEGASSDPPDEGVVKVPGRELGFHYVDREIVVARTTEKGRLEDSAAAETAIRLDLLLSATDQTPIAGEVKIRTDKDPFFALVQVLASGAFLATTPQRARLVQHCPDRFSEEARGGLDLYIVLVEFPETGTTYLPRFLQAAQELSWRLLAMPEVSRVVRRIACLDASLEMGNLKLSRRFAYERRGSTTG